MAAPLTLTTREVGLSLLAVVVTTISSFVMPAVAIVVLVKLLLSSWWPLAVIYLTWIWFIDRNTPFVGGREVHCIRRSRIWDYFANYFPSKLIKSTDLDSKSNYIFACHPHGVIAMGTFNNLMTNASGFSEKFPGISTHGLMLNVAFLFPWFREQVMSMGVCSVSKESIYHLCTKKSGGNAVLIAVGGARESLDAHPDGSVLLQLRNRKGFVKMALVTGADLVPVYSFGENEIYSQVNNAPGSLVRKFQDTFKAITSFSPLLFYGRWYTLIPYQVQLTTVVGEPIAVPLIENPDSDDINKYHDLYIQSLEKLFEKHKAEWAISPNLRLLIE